MAAWEIESRSWGGLIQPLSSHAKRALCLDAIGLCLASFRPSLEEALGAPTARLARRALDLLRERAGDSAPGRVSGEFQDGLRALRKRARSPAVASIVAALTEYAEATSSADFDASDVLTVLSACYDAVLNTGRGDEPLSRLIAAQRGLIEAVAFA